MITEETVGKEIRALTESLFGAVVHAEGITEGDELDFSAISHTALVEALALNMLTLGLDDAMLDVWLDETRDSLKEAYLEHYSRMPRKRTLQ